MYSPAGRTAMRRLVKDEASRTGYSDDPVLSGPGHDSFFDRRMIMNRSYKKTILRLSSVLLTVTMAAAPAFASYAATPEFARSEEEWAHLRDNALEWYEIEDLIHEYNATVLKNREELSKDERRNMDAEEIRDYLLDEADEMDSLASYADSAMLAATYQMQANSLRSQADGNVTDFEIIRLDYEVIEKNLFRTAQDLFLDYYSALARKSGAEAGVAYFERAYASAVNRKNVGIATELDVLTAQENLENARAALVADETEIRTSLTNLQVLCGWAYESAAEIREVPEVDPASFAAIDPEADLAQALAASYTLRTDEIRLRNARSNYPNLVAQYESQLAADTNSFKVNFRGTYDSLINAGLACSNARADLALKAQDLAAAERKFSLGLISQMEYEGVRNDLATMQTAEQTSYLAMVGAKAAYDAAVRGIL